MIANDTGRPLGPQATADSLTTLPDLRKAVPVQSAQLETGPSAWLSAQATGMNLALGRDSHLEVGGVTTAAGHRDGERKTIFDVLTLPLLLQRPAKLQ